MLHKHLCYAVLLLSTCCAGEHGALVQKADNVNGDWQAYSDAA